MFSRFMCCRRGTVAVTFALAAIPLIGLVGLGSEAGMWYATQRHAQNAADAAAYSGALRLATPDAQTIAYRGKEFAAQNGFCNPSDTSYPGTLCTLATAATQGVTISSPPATGPYAGNAQAVQAVVSQSQIPLLSALFLSGPISIQAQAVAALINVKPVCALGLTGMTLGGSSTLSGGNCALVSDAAVKFNSTVTFNGAGWAVDGVTGCKPSSTCGSVSVPTNYHIQPATNPLAVLDTTTLATISSSALSPSCVNSHGNSTCTMTPSTTQAYGNVTIGNGDVWTMSSGTYFFYNATLKMTGGALTGTNVNIVLLGNSSITINSGTVNLSACSTTSVPACTPSFSALNGVLIDDQAGASSPGSSQNAVNISGGGSSTFNGALYFPYADVTWGGNAASAFGCTEVVGYTVSITGNSNFATDACPASLVPRLQAAMLVQ
jgi:hypothetical protein